MAITYEDELVFGTVETRSYFKIRLLSGKAFYRVVPKDARRCKCVRRTAKNGVEHFDLIDNKDLFDVNNPFNPNLKETVIRKVHSDGHVSYVPIKDMNVEDGFIFEAETKTGTTTFVIGESRLSRAKMVIGDGDKIIALIRDGD